MSWENLLAGEKHVYLVNSLEKFSLLPTKIIKWFLHLHYWFIGVWDIWSSKSCLLDYHFFKEKTKLHRDTIGVKKNQQRI